MSCIYYFTFWPNAISTTFCCFPSQPFQRVSWARRYFSPCYQLEYVPVATKWKNINRWSLEGYVSAWTWLSHIPACRRRFNKIDLLMFFRINFMAFIHCTFKKSTKYFNTFRLQILKECVGARALLHARVWKNIKILQNSTRSKIYNKSSAPKGYSL